MIYPAVVRCTTTAVLVLLSIIRDNILRSIIIAVILLFLIRYTSLASGLLTQASIIESFDTRYFGSSFMLYYFFSSHGTTVLYV